MTKITFTREDGILRIKIDTPLQSSDAIDHELEQLISDTTEDLVIRSGLTLEVNDRIFSHYLGKSIKLNNIVLSEIAIRYIPTWVESFQTNAMQDSLELLKVQKLDILAKDGQYIDLPSTVTELVVRSQKGERRRITINCTDNLEQVSLIGDDIRVNLLNCNRLQHLSITGFRARVYGIQHYLTSLNVSNPVDRDYILDFVNLKTLSSEGRFALTIDDIPDTVTALYAELVDENGHYIHSSDILNRKPNIKAIYFQEDTHENGDVSSAGLEAMEKYSDVDFIPPDYATALTRKIINSHNTFANVMRNLQY